jgi:dTDP-4-amino-4,6-dideoxygalactose transaminase
MVLTDNEDWAHTAEYLTTQAKDDPIEYVHHRVGYNYRLSNLQAAMGCAQMERIEGYIEAKRRIAAAYRTGLEDIPGLELMGQATWAESVFWLSTVLVDQGRYGMDSRALLRQLQLQGIESRPLWQPLHLSPAHASCQAYQGGVAERLYKDALSLPSSVGLDSSSQQRVLSHLTSLAAAGQSPR